MQRSARGGTRATTRKFRKKLTALFTPAQLDPSVNNTGQQNLKVKVRFQVILSNVIERMKAMNVLFQLLC